MMSNPKNMTQVQYSNGTVKLVDIGIANTEHSTVVSKFNVSDNIEAWLYTKLYVSEDIPKEVVILRGELIEHNIDRTNYRILYYLEYLYDRLNEQIILNQNNSKRYYVVKEITLHDMMITITEQLGQKYYEG